MPTTFLTVWTGLAGNGLWSDDNNWTQGAPISGASFASGADDVATIDNSSELAPFTVTIDGAAFGSTVNINLTDPVGAPAARLTGTLDLSTHVTPTGGTLGSLNLQAGTLEVDGGTLRALTVEQGGDFGNNGVLTFGDQSTYGAAYLDAVGIQNSFTIGNNADVIVSSFAIFEGQHGSAPDTVDLEQNAILAVQGSLSLHGELVTTGGFLELQASGQITGDSYGARIVSYNSGTILVLSDFTFNNTQVEGDITFNNEQIPAPFALHTTGWVNIYNASAGTAEQLNLAGDTLDIEGQTTLRDVQAQGGLLKLEAGGALILDPGTGLGGFANLTIEAADPSSSAAPTVIDLHGGSYTVSGDLTLNNVLFSNGTLNVINGAQIIVNDNASANGLNGSIADFSNVSVHLTDIVATPKTLNGNPDVHIISGVNELLQNSELDIVTGANGAPGRFFLDPGLSGPNDAGEISGAGLVLVTDSAGGTPTAYLGGLTLANVAGQTLHIDAVNWTLTDPTLGAIGTAEAVDGGSLEIGDAAQTGVTDLNNGVLRGSYLARNGGAILLDGDSAITTIDGDVTIDGAASQLLASYASDPSTRVLTSYDQSLTAIGGTTGTGFFSSTLGHLNLLGGANLSLANNLDVTGAITLQGGTISAPSLTLHFAVLGQQAFYSTIIGFGAIDATVSGGAVAANGGALTVVGSVGTSILKTIAAAPLLTASLATISPTTLHVTGDASHDQMSVAAGTTITIDGLATNVVADLGAQSLLFLGDQTANPNFVSFDDNGANGATLDLGTPGGAAYTLMLGGNPNGVANTSFDGNSLHLEKALLDESRGSGRGLELQITPQGGVLTVHLKDDSGAALADAVFTIQGPISNEGIVTLQDGNGGTIIQFGRDATLSEPYLTAPTLANVHVQAGGTNKGDIVVTNPAADSAGTLNSLTVDGAFDPASIRGDLVASGGFTGLKPGHTTADIADAIPITEVADDGSTPISVGIKTDHAGLISGKVTVALDSVIDPATLPDLPPGTPTRAYTVTEDVAVKGAVYDYANVVFDHTTVVLHRGDVGESYFSIANQTVTSASYQEGLEAALVSSNGDFLAPPDDSITTPLAAGGSTRIGFAVDTSQSAPQTQTETTIYHIVSDGAGTSGLGKTDQGDKTVTLTAELNDYADALMTLGGASGTLALVDSDTPDKSADPASTPPVQTERADLGTFDQFANVDDFILRIRNIAGLDGVPADALGGALQVDSAVANFDGSAFNNYFPSWSPLASDAVNDHDGFSINTDLAGTFSEGIIFRPTSVNVTSTTPLKPVEIIVTFHVLDDGPVGGGWGDPHLTTFDGLHYDFQGAGDFILTQTTGAARAAGDNFAVQSRMVPAGPGARVSLFHEIAVETGAHRVTVDTDRLAAGAGMLWIDGARVDLAADATLVLSDGGSVRRISAADEYIVTAAHGETADVTGHGSWESVTVGLGKSGPKGAVQGLLGDANSNYRNDLQLSDGAGGFTSPGTTLTAAQLYSDPNSLANTWRVTDVAQSLLDYASGQSPATDNVTTFPLTPVDLTSLPTTLAQTATQALANAGVTDPTLAADAALDYALTGDNSFITGAVTTQQQLQSQPTTPIATVTVTPPAPTVSYGVAPTATRFSDAGAVAGQVYLTRALSTSVTLTYAVIDTGLAGYLGSSGFGAAATGSVTLAAGQTAATFSLTPPSLGNDLTDKLRVAITSVVTGDGSVAPTPLAASADFLIFNHAPAAGVAAQPAFVEIAGGGVLTQTDATHWTLALGDVLKGSAQTDLALGVANLGPDKANVITGAYALSGDFTASSQSGPNGLIDGAIARGLNFNVDTTTLGAHGETVTLNATQSNFSGYSAALAPITLAITDNVVANLPLQIALISQIYNDTGASTIDGVTRDGHVALHGSIAGGAGGATVEIFNGADDLGAASVTGAGWTFSALLADGAYSLQAVATDSGGATASARAPLALLIDSHTSQGPIADAAVTLGSDNVAYLNAAHFNGGSTTLTGVAEAGDRVVITDAIQNVVATATADAATGQWSAALNALSDGLSYSLVATASDLAGNTAASAAFAFTVDVSAPAVAISNASGAVTKAAQTVGGTGEVGALVRLTDNGVPVGAAVTVDSTGHWSEAVTLALGNNTLLATAQDAAGNTKASNSVLYQYNPVTLALATDSGASRSDRVTNIANLTGTAQPRARVTLTEGARLLGVVVADAGGHWTFAPRLADGAHTITASQTIAGATSSASLAFTLDTVTHETPISAPLWPGPNGRYYLDAAQFHGGMTTLTGHAEAGDSIVLTDSSGRTVGATVADATSGAWTIPVSGLVNGQTYNYLATATDLAGNIARARLLFTVRTDPPAVSIANSGGAVSSPLQTISGLGSAGGLITLFDNARLLATTTVHANGAWSVEVTLPNIGANRLLAREADLYGNIGLSPSVALSLTSTPLHIVSGGGGAASAYVVEAGATFVGGVQASADPGHAISYALVNAAGLPATHVSGFVIDAGAGALSAAQPLAVGRYFVTVEAIDSTTGAIARQSVTVDAGRAAGATHVLRGETTLGVTNTYEVGAPQTYDILANFRPADQSLSGQTLPHDLLAFDRRAFQGGANATVSDLVTLIGRHSIGYSDRTLIAMDDGARVVLSGVTRDVLLANPQDLRWA